MTSPNTTRRAAIAAARKAAEAAGYYVGPGSFRGTTDDRLGRWYTGCHGEPFRPLGLGHATEGDAWLAAAEWAADRATR